MLSSSALSKNTALFKAANILGSIAFDLPKGLPDGEILWHGLLPWRYYRMPWGLTPDGIVDTILELTDLKGRSVTNLL